MGSLASRAAPLVILLPLFSVEREIAAKSLTRALAPHKEDAWLTRQ